jgi:hypothetical protein
MYTMNIGVVQYFSVYSKFQMHSTNRRRSQKLRNDHKNSQHSTHASIAPLVTLSTSVGDATQWGFAVSLI